jgi:hypothetical protein
MVVTLALFSNPGNVEGILDQAGMAKKGRTWVQVSRQ